MTFKLAIILCKFYHALVLLIQSYPAFAEYHDLLEALDEKLSSVVDSAKR